MTWKPNGLPLVVLLAAVAGLWTVVWGAAAEKTWLRTFAGLDYGAFFDVVLTNDGALLAVGTTCHPLVETTRGDVLVAKLTLDGDLVW